MNKTLKQMTIVSLFFLSFCTKAFSGQEYLGNCATKGLLKGGCNVFNPTLHSGAQYNGKPYQANYVVSYTFNCLGHDISAGISVENHFTPFTRGNSDQVQYVSVEGLGPLKVRDNNPSYTKNYALFHPSCSLQILNVVYADPTLVQLNAWVDEAKLHARTVEYAVDLFQLGNDWLHLADWTNTQLTNLRAELKQESEVSTDPDTVENLATIIGFIDVALQNQPLPPDFDEQQGNLKAALKARLNREIAIAQEMLARFDYFHRTREETLVAAVDAAQESSGYACALADGTRFKTVANGCRDTQQGLTVLAFYRTPMRQPEATATCNAIGGRLPGNDESNSMLTHVAWVFGQNTSFQFWTLFSMNGNSQLKGGTIAAGANGSSSDYNSLAGPEAKSAFICVRSE